MRISNLPIEIEDSLYRWQLHEIERKIEAPIVVVNQTDPVWQRLDDLLTVTNIWTNLSKNGEIQCTIHEILPGVQAAWVADDHTYEDPSSSEGQWILINAADLQSIRHGGKPGLMVDRLFRDF